MTRNVAERGGLGIVPQFPPYARAYVRVGTNLERLPNPPHKINNWS